MADQLAGAPRRDAIAALAASRGFVRVADLAEELGVSEVTVRTDLTALERGGRVVRVHGGAMPPPVGRETALERSADRAADAKAAIGRAAAALVRPGDSVFLDVGSTALAVAEALLERTDLHDVVLVTSGLTIALALEPGIPRWTVVVAGGTLRPLQHSLVAPFAAPLLGALRIDLAFIGCNGVDAEAGATNVNLPEAEVKRDVLAHAARGILIADASKLGRVEVGVIAPLAAFDSLITAGPVPADLALPIPTTHA